MNAAGARLGTRFRSWWALALVVIMIGLAPLALLAYLVEARATEAVRTQARASLSGTASLTARFLDEQLRGIEQVMDSYADRRPLQQALEGPRGIDTRELTRQMEELAAARSDVLNVTGIADTAGTMLAGTVMPPPGTDFSQRDWHRTVLRTGKPYVSEAIVGRSPGSPLAIAVATPVRDSDERVVAIIVAGYTLENFQRFVARFAQDQGTDITVTDQRGVVIARPGSAPTTLDSRAGDPRVRSALAGRSGISERGRNAAGKRVLSAYSPVRGLGWTVVAELPRAQAYAAVERLHTAVVLITVPLAVLFVLGGVLLARAIRSRDAARQRRAVGLDQLGRPQRHARGRVADRPSRPIHPPQRDDGGARRHTGDSARDGCLRGDGAHRPGDDRPGRVRCRRPCARVPARPRGDRRVHRGELGAVVPPLLDPGAR